MSIAAQYSGPPVEELSMFIKNWKKEILTIPNLLSLGRLLMIPVYVRLYLHANAPHDFIAPGIVLAVSCLTDALDGYIARRFQMVSLLGKVLDPLADKATQLALILCLGLKYPVMKWMLALLLLKEGFQIVACIVNFYRGKILLGALPAGKVCTAVLFTSLMALVILPEPDVWLVTAIVSADCFFLTISFLSYVLAYHGRHPKTRDVDF